MLPQKRCLKLGGSEMLFNAFSWRCFLKKINFGKRSTCKESEIEEAIFLAGSPHLMKTSIVTDAWKKSMVIC